MATQATEQKIWKFLVSNGMTEAGAAGVMGNMMAESGLESAIAETSYMKKMGLTSAEYIRRVDSGEYTNFVHDAIGVGLIGFTYYTLKAGLLDLARSRKKSVGDMDVQLDYLIIALKQYGSSVLNVLKTTGDVRTASNTFLLQFERPADQSQSMQDRRYGFSMQFYQKFSGGATMGYVMTAGEFVRRLKDIEANYKTLYVNGGIGAPLTASYKQYYLTNTPYNRKPERQAMIRAASEDTFSFDCSGLGKGVGWGWNGSRTAAYGGAKYASNGIPDNSTEGMIAACSDVSTGNWQKLAPGELLWMQGHVGYYIGDGLCIECSPAWKNCVQKTAVGNIGKKAGYNSRTWVKHGKLKWIDYTAKTEEEEEMTQAQFDTMLSKSLNGSNKQLFQTLFNQALEERNRSLQDNDAGEWSKEARDWAVSTGLIAGNGTTTTTGEPGYGWESDVAREALVTVLYRFAKMIGQA